MSRLYPADTRSQKVLEELYEKETISQLNWFLKCQQAKNIHHDNTSVRPSTIVDTSLPKTSLKSLPKSNTEDKEDLAEQSNEIHLTDNVIKEQNHIDAIELDMYKPSNDVLKLLYDGISKEGKGRSRYLHDRYKLNLEDKFQFPVLSSMEYGWGHADLISKSTAQSRKFGRQCVIEDSFCRRTGIPFKHGAGMLGLDKYSF
ncbi:unnamed protein product [Schistosoma rodhaini]|uniref:WD repeat-containing protein 76 n=1 Tax=Schistosoma rodhaini TaxID=6188 RepID=A0AA85FMN3_9TREM|nr:unnamed protein product [Schistosoma rodhaini]